MRSAPLDASPRPLRVALYSHDTQGLGHVRRNLGLAAALAGGGETDADVLLVTGAAEVADLPRPPQTDVVVLPSLGKDAAGRYHPRRLRLPLDDVVGLRAGLLRAALSGFDPDLLVVDKVPRGVAGELEPALEHLRAGGRTRVVLGLRDVLDEPGAAAAEWEQARVAAALERWYDEVWVYSDATVADPLAGLALPPGMPVRHTGYLGRVGAVGPSPRGVAPPAPSPPYALCLVGGGQDGAALAETFAAARRPDGWAGVVVCGPYMPSSARERLRDAARRDPRLSVLGVAEDVEVLIAGAEAVVCMGGYNTTCEVLAAGARALVVPRTRPRREQEERARLLAARGLVDTLPPDDLSAEALGAWLRAPRRDDVGERPLDLDGLSRVPALAADLVSTSRPAEEVARAL